MELGDPRRHEEAGFATGERAAGIYSIGAMARMLETSPATLRNWEGRYAIVVPERSQGGHRLYSRLDLEKLRFVVAHIGRGLSPADAHRMLAERLSSDGSMPRRAPTEAPRLSVLLAERDRRAAELTEYFLRTEGYEVLLAFDAPTAEELLRDAPDLVIIELMISGGIGTDLCRRLKREGSSPVLAISSVELREAALEAGADAFLKKPFQPLTLVSATRDLLGTSAVLSGGVGS